MTTWRRRRNEKDPVKKLRRKDVRNAKRVRRGGRYDHMFTQLKRETDNG